MITKKLRMAQLMVKRGSDSSVQGSVKSLLIPAISVPIQREWDATSESKRWHTLRQVTVADGTALLLIQTIDPKAKLLLLPTVQGHNPRSGLRVPRCPNGLFTSRALFRCIEERQWTLRLHRAVDRCWVCRFCGKSTRIITVRSDPMSAVFMRDRSMIERTIP
jgi:hypothetical protein